MKEKIRIKAKIMFILTSLAIGWPVGFLISALLYFLTDMKNGRTSLQFTLIAGSMAFLLAMISGGLFRSLVEKKVRDGEMPVNTYRREQNVFLCLLPQNSFIQVLVCAIRVGIRALLAAGGIAVLIGEDHMMTPVAGSLVCGLIVGFAVVSMGYYMMVTKVSNMDTQARLAKNAGHKQEERSFDRTEVRTEEQAAAAAAAKEKIKVEVPEFKVPKMTAPKKPEFKVPESRRKPEKENSKVKEENMNTEEETPIEELGLPENETPKYSVDASTGVLPDMEVLGLDYEDLDDFGDNDGQ